MQNFEVRARDGIIEDEVLKRCIPIIPDPDPPNKVVAFMTINRIGVAALFGVKVAALLCDDGFGLTEWECVGAR